MITLEDYEQVVPTLERVEDDIGAAVVEHADYGSYLQGRLLSISKLAKDLREEIEKHLEEG